MAAQREPDSDKNEGAGGGFGKFRKRPFRKSAATPYARPPPASLSASSGGGWISKLVDPAQKLLTSGAQRFFASVFRKRLTNTSSQPSYATTTEPVPNAETETSEGGAIVTPSFGSHFAKPISSENPNNSIQNDSISDLEEALQQQTFTRYEVERLTTLLQSKIVDQPSIEAIANPGTTRLTLPIVRNDGASKIPPSDNYRGNIATSISNTSGFNGRLDDVASPTELAKAFMDGRSSYAFPSKITSFKPSLLNESNGLTSTSHSPKSPSMTLIPSSTDQGGFQQSLATPRSIGRSALYGMVRTPYSRSIWSNNSQGPRTQLSSLVGASSSCNDSGKLSKSIGSKPESLKRRSSVIENDVDAGNIRRIRQKSNLLPSSGILSSGSSRFLLESSQAKSIKGKSVVKFEASAKTTNDSGHASKFSMIPSKSSEMATKILQQLDTLVSSREKSPTKLSQTMLRGPALRSLENIEPPKFLLNDYHDNQPSQTENPLPLQKAKLTDDDDERNVVKWVTESLNESAVQDVISSSVRSTTKGLSEAISVVETPASSVKKRAFQMSAHEDHIELDDDEYSNGCVEKGREKKAVGNSVTDLIRSNKSLLVESEENVENNNFAAGPFSATVTPATAHKETPVVFDKLSPPQSVSMSSQTSASAPESHGDVKHVSSPIPDNTTSFARSSPTDSMKDPMTKILHNDGFQKEALKVSEPPSAPSSFVTPSIFSFGSSATNSSPSNGSLASSSILFSSLSTASTLGSTTSTPAASFFKFGSPVSQSPSPSEAPQPTSEPADTKISKFEFGATTFPSSAPLSEISTSAAVGSSSFAPFSFAAPASFGGTSTAATSTSGVFGSSLSSGTTSSILGTTSSLSAPGAVSNSSSPSTTIFGPSGDVFSSSTPSTVLFGASSGSSISFSLASAPIVGSSSTAASFSSSPFPLFNASSGATTTSSTFPLFNASSGATTTSSLFESSSSAAISSSGNSIFNFNSGATSSTSNQFPFNSFTSSTQSSSSSTPAPFQFGSSISSTSPFSSSGPVSPSVFNSTWQAPNSSSSPTAAFSFGSSTATKSTPFSFGSPIPAQHLANSEQNMEDNMAEDTVNAASPPVFNPQAMSGTFAFGSNNANTANQIGAQSPFQFGGQPNPSPFQATGSVDFQGSGSFSLGAGGGEKATRRIVKVRKTMRKR